MLSKEDRDSLKKVGYTFEEITEVETSLVEFEQTNVVYTKKEIESTLKQSLQNKIAANV